MTAEVLDFPEDIIPVDTGIPLADADPEVIARRLRFAPWADRARFFNNIINHGMERGAKMMDYVEGGEVQVRRFIAWLLVCQQGAIADVLDLWRECNVTCAPQAAVYLLSLDGEHRTLANSWLTENRKPYHDMREWACEWPQLVAFNAHVLVQQPATYFAMNAVPAYSDVTFRVPEGA